VRHGLSLLLPGLTLALNHPKAEVMQTAQERNWPHSVAVDHPTGGYQVFFELRRAAAGPRPMQYLNVVVESAYLEETERDRRNIRGRMGFILLCGKVYRGEPVATRR
jgi:hypothetical protein